MSAAEASAKKFAALLKRLRKAEPPEAYTPESTEPVLAQLVYSMLLCEASSGQAKAAYRRLREATVDFNELRVCVPDEVSLMLGERYPLVAERSLRLRSVLNAVYRARHEMSLGHLLTAPKREARQFLDSLDGITPFVTARVVVVCLGGHAVPVDERLRDLLSEENILSSDTAPEDAAAALERLVKSDNAAEVHTTLSAWSDEHGHPPKRDRATAVVAPEPREPARPAVRAADAPKARSSRAKSSS